MRLSLTFALLAPFVASTLAVAVKRDAPPVPCLSYKVDPKDVWGDKVRLLTDDEISARGGGGGGRKKRDIGGAFWREENKVLDNDGIEYYWSAGMDESNNIEFASRRFDSMDLLPYHQWRIDVTFKNGAAPASYWLSSDVTCNRKAGYSPGDIDQIYVSRRHPSKP